MALLASSKLRCGALRFLSPRGARGRRGVTGSLRGLRSGQRKDKFGHAVLAGADDVLPMDLSMGAPDFIPAGGNKFRRLSGIALQCRTAQAPPRLRRGPRKTSWQGTTVYALVSVKINLVTPSWLVQMMFCPWTCPWGPRISFPPAEINSAGFPALRCNAGRRKRRPAFGGAPGKHHSKGLQFTLWSA